jgi:adenylylsulfate kinase
MKDSARASKNRQRSYSMPSPSCVSGAHDASVIWLTGLSGAGKSTVALALYEEMLRRDVPTQCLDGDAIRNLFPGLGFSRDERDAHVVRVGDWASRLEDEGVTAICALISPYRQARAQVRRRCRRFFEVYLSTPLHECERRDPKGLYAGARRHEIRHFTGVDDPYETPEAPDLTIDTTVVEVGESVARIIAAITQRIRVDATAGFTL